MSGDLRGLGRTVELRRPRPGRRIALLLAVLIVAGAVAARASDDQDPRLEELVLAPDPPAVAADATGAADAAGGAGAASTEAAPPVAAVEMPVMGRVGDLLLRVPAETAVLVSYHEAAFPEAQPIAPSGTLLGNENPTRELRHEPDPDGIGFHVQVSRGRPNASTSAVDIVLPPGEEVRAPVAGTVVEVRPYQLYGRHDDLRVELRPDDAPDWGVVLIHLQDVVVRPGDRVQVGDVLAGAARMFPFSAVVDRQTEPERYGHVHLEVKQPAEDDVAESPGG